MNNTKVLLINPSYQPHWSRCEPTGLLYIASYLKSKGIDCDILDYNVDDVSSKKLIKSIQVNKYGIVGISAITPQAPRAYELGREIKKRFNDKVTLVYGGVHPSLLPDEAFVKGAADYVIAGEAEIPFHKLCMAKQGKQRIEDVPNLYIKEENKIKQNKTCFLLEDLDLLPFPDYNKIDLEKYNTNIHLEGFRGRTIHILSSRGCDGDCYFCASPKLYRKKIRYRSVKNVIDEIEDVKSRFDVEYIHFHDDNFLSDPKRVNNFSKELINRNIDVKWICLSSVNSVLDNKHNLRLLHDAGCIGMEIGIESADAIVLKKLNKKVSIEDMKNASNMLKNAGIHPMFLFMSYSLGETIDTSVKSINLFYELKHQRGFTELPIEQKKFDPDLAGHLARPSPGSVFFKIAKQKGIVLAKEWSEHFEENLTFLPNTFLDDVPEHIHFIGKKELENKLRRYKDNFILYANQNFYISRNIMKDFFADDWNNFFSFALKVYADIDGKKTVAELSRPLGETEKEQLSKVAPIISMLSIIGKIRSKI